MNDMYFVGFGGSLMRKWLAFVLLLGCLAIPSPADAQGGIKLKSINIQLWAEFDQPSMLVIHQFTLDENTPLPAKVTLRFPKDGNLIAVAYLGDTMINADFTGPESQGNWQTVTLDVQSYAPHRIEYYQPLIRDGNQRSFSFRWFGDYAVEEFSVTAQLPADSANISMEPPFSNTAISEDGLHFIGVLMQQNLKMGQSNEFIVTYERTSDSVTMPLTSDNIQPSEPIGPNTEGRVSIDNLPWIIGGFGLALIGLAFYFYWRSTQVSEQKSRRRSGHRDVSTGGEQAYCHECGTRANAGDRFCRTCGSKLRI
jgi:hypothetical protein